jgi:hypothetical protein
VESVVQITFREALAAFGGATAVLTGLAIFVGRVAGTRVAQKQKAELDTKIETLKNEVRVLSEERFDALTRRRDVYSRLATGMRVFVESVVPSGPKERQEFLTAYDQACVWGSEAVVERIGTFLDVMTLFSQDRSPEGMQQKQDAYAACILEMRRDVGFPGSKFQFRFVTFEK